MSLQSLIDKPKELLELIESCLKPKNIEKKMVKTHTPKPIKINNLKTILNNKQK